MTVCANPIAQYYMVNATATSDCVQIDGADCLGFRDGFGFNPGGRAIWYVDNNFGAAGETAFNTIDGFRIDEAGAPSTGFLSAQARSR